MRNNISPVLFRKYVLGPTHQKDKLLMCFSPLFTFFCLLNKFHHDKLLNFPPVDPGNSTDCSNDIRKE